MNFRTWLAGAVVTLCLFVPATSHAQTVSELQAQIQALLAQIAALQNSNPSGPSAGTGSVRITVQEPDAGDEYGRSEDMPITWTTSGISRPMVVEGVVKLLEADPEDVGAVGGGSFIKPIQRGSTTGEYVWEWGNNDSIPGIYSVTLQLRECNRRGCDVAPAGRTITRKTAPVEFTVTMDTADSEKAEAENAYLEARDALRDAWKEVGDAQDDGVDVEDAKDLLDEAEQMLREARMELGEGDYEETQELVEEIHARIEEALSLIGGEDTTLEIIDIEIEAHDADEGAAPFTVVVTGAVEAQMFDARCPIVFPDPVLKWGDGSTGSIMAEVVTTSRNTSTECRQTLTQSYTHTYTHPGTYTVEYLVPGHGRDVLRIDVHGVAEVSATIDAKSYSTSTPVLTGTASGTNRVNVVLTGLGDKYSYTEPVRDGKWSHSVRTSLQDGTHPVVLFDGVRVGTKLGSGSFTVRTTRTEHAAPSCTITASPSRITAGSPVVVSWSSKNAGSAMLSGTSVSTSGGGKYYPTSTTTYSLTVFGYTGGKSACSTSVTVVPLASTPVPSVRPSDVQPYYYLQDQNRPTQNVSNISATALLSMESQLKDMSRMLEELFR